MKMKSNIMKSSVFRDFSLWFFSTLKRLILKNSNQMHAVSHSIRILHSIRRTVLGVLFLIAFRGFASVIFPEETWQEASPQQRGMNARQLDALAARIGGTGVIIKDGYLVKGWGTLRRQSNWFGASNPILSTLLFFAMEEGRIANVSTKVKHYYWDLDSKDRAMDFFHLANMTSGYARLEAAGMAWHYNDYGIALFHMTLMDRVFNASATAVFLNRNRFAPLDFEDRPVFQDRSHSLVASVRDFARIAWFWCQKGKWANKQLLPRSYFDRYCQAQIHIDVTTSLQTEDNDYLYLGNSRNESAHFGDEGRGIYGFGWWFNRGNQPRLTCPDAPADTFMCIGMRGKVAILIPSLDLILVSAFSDWGKLRPSDPQSLFNQHIKHLTQSLL